MPYSTSSHNKVKKESILITPIKSHGNLTRYPWARLWYYLRALDTQGRGWVEVSWSQTKQILGCGYSTLYQWLREAKEAGAIYHYKRKGDRLTVRLGGLFNVCQTLGLNGWGAVTTLPLGEVLEKCRMLATAIATQELQERSRYAAYKSLNKSEKQTFRMPSAFDVIEMGRTASLKPIRGANKIPYLLHVGAKRAFVSKGFIPFGASEVAIASSLGISDRTVRRHLTSLEIDRRQLVQAKHAYRFIKAGIELNINDAYTEPGISYQLKGRELILHEPNGRSSSKRKDGHHIPLSDNGLTTECDRFFNYYGQTWMYRCNLYDLDFEFNSMRFARRKFKKQLKSHKPSLSSKPSLARISAHK